MTRLISTSTLALALLGFTLSPAHAGSEVERSITTNIDGQGIIALAIKDSKASQGAVSIEGSKVKGDIKTTVKGQGIIALGIVGSEAHQGSVTIK